MKRSSSLLVCGLALGVALFSGGCVTQQNLATADFGPSPANAEEKTREYFNSALKDPESARIKFVGLHKAFSIDGLIIGGAKHYGWVQVVEVNAKNSYGGYTGSKLYYIFFEGGSVRGDVSDYIGSHMAGLVD